MNSGTAGSAKTLFEPSFLIAVAVLATAAFGIGPRLLRDTGPKLEVPLKSPLAKLDKDALRPYLFKTQVPLNSAVQEVLGTDEFIDFRFTDSRVEDISDPIQSVRVSVSYYTGGRDKVPHTPDQCWLGSGYTPTEKEEIELEIPSLGRKVPVRVLTFEKSAIMAKERTTVAYFFQCNGDYVCNRNDVRLRMNSLVHKHAYFAKVEVVFGSNNSVPRTATREASIPATAQFLDALLPVLERDHFPDWNAVVAEEEKAPAQKS